jgi:hypothetical protein
MLRQIRRDTLDEHLLFSAIGQNIGFLPEESVRNAFLAMWCLAKPEQRDQVLQRIQRDISTVSAAA